MKPLLKLSNLSKSFPGVQALDSIDLEIARGEVHGLLGENGAGKSTLVKIIAGVYRKDSGTIYFDGQDRNFSSPSDASHAGINMIYQETSLIPTLTVLENMFLGIEHTSFLNIIDNRRTRQEFDAVCERLKFHPAPDRVARDLSVAEQKMVEIMKGMIREAKLIIMDEPTDALTDLEIANLFRTIQDLKKDLVTILYITHYLQEVFDITDRMTVLKDGRKVGTHATREVDQDSVVKMMIGQEIASFLAVRSQEASKREAIRVEKLTRRPAVDEVSFAAYEGEVLGITGVLGSGKTELARVLFGADRPDSGLIYIGNKRCNILTPVDAVANGIGMLPEDRKKLGLILNHEVYKNISITVLKKLSNWILVDRKRELAAAERLVNELSIRNVYPRQLVKYLSGGNQQKVVIAKWLISEQKILIMDEPTRGIDVGSKAEIHNIVRQLADRGACVIFISTEVPEVVQIADRILVMQNGKISAEYSRGVSQQEIVRRLLKGNDR